VNTKNFTPPKRYHDNLTKPIKLLYCGAWAPEKGLGVLLRALVYIQRSNPNMYTLTITSNPHMWYTDFPSIDASYIRMVRQLIRKVSGVTLLGGLKREELPQIYHAHDYTLMPSMWEEPFGLVALESIASGTPVIAFRSGGLPEILASSNAFLLEKKIGALQQVLQRIAQRNKGVQKPVHLTNKNKHMHMDYRIAKFSVYINSILLHEPDMTARNS
jgi:glycosyltransferase involved in cell wall biosynthesis